MKCTYICSLGQAPARHERNRTTEHILCFSVEFSLAGKTSQKAVLGNGTVAWVRYDQRSGLRSQVRLTGKG